jgi:hypothetical protein
MARLVGLCVIVWLQLASGMMPACVAVVVQAFVVEVQDAEPKNAEAEAGAHELFARAWILLVVTSVVVCSWL